MQLVNVNVNELRLGFSNTTRNPEGIRSHISPTHWSLGTHSPSSSMCGRGVSVAWLHGCREIGNRASLLPPTAPPNVQAALAVAVPDLTNVLTRYRRSLDIVERAMVCLQNIGTEAKDAVRDQREQPSHIEHAFVPTLPRRCPPPFLAFVDSLVPSPSSLSLFMASYTF